jgi:uncharacterized membrane protein
VEGLIALLAFGVVAALLVAPILALIAFVKVSGLRSEVREMRSLLGGLEARLGALQKRYAADRVARAEAQAVSPSPVVTEPRVAAAEEPPPVPSIEPAASRSVAAPRPAFTPPPQRPKPPAPPAAPAFEWESLLGVKGAAWLGGIALFTAAVLLIKLAIDQGLITPALRIGLLVTTGLGLLLGAELYLRRGYATTANALSGSGVAILYAAFFAGHNLYGLFPMSVAFALMIVVTVTAVVASVRYDSPAIALLGLLGGFATPLLLSTGEDRPIGLFSYLLLLNLGLLFVALRRGWHAFVLLSVLATFFIEMGWVLRFVRVETPLNVLIGVVVFFVFGLLFLLAPLTSSTRDDGVLLSAGTLGGLAPFVFGLYLAGSRTLATDERNWPLLFGLVALLDAALIAVALLRRRALLMVAAAVATTTILPLWAAHGLTADTLWGATFGAVALALLLNLPARLSAFFVEASRRGDMQAMEATGLIAGLGLGLFGIALIAQGRGNPPWAFLFVAASLTAIVLERSGAGRIRGAFGLAAPGVALLIQVWFFAIWHDVELMRNLAIPALYTITLSLATALRRGEEHAREDETGVVAANAIAIVGLFLCLTVRGIAFHPVPLFAALAVANFLLIVSAVRREWVALAPVALIATAAFATLWHTAYFYRYDGPFALPIYALFYVAFLALPFGVLALTSARWQRHRTLWLASALSGPFFFYVLYRGWIAVLGRSAIGLLPLAMAALSVAALAGVERRFVIRAADPASGPRRLAFLALFAAVALGFIATAIPVQLARQWITIGWALEAVAVWWLYDRLSHVGLKLFGAALFAAVGVRLLFNPWIFEYHERGWPILNWLLYTYGLSALCCLVGAAVLRRAERSRQASWLPRAASLLGLILIFWLINLEIADFFSVGRRHITWTWTRHYARDMALSVAWGLYALALLVVGLWRRTRTLRFVSLAVIMLATSKVFLYDLASVRGIYRVLSFLALSVSLILISLLYQRFVFRRETPR